MSLSVQVFTGNVTGRALLSAVVKEIVCAGTLHTSSTVVERFISGTLDVSRDVARKSLTTTHYHAAVATNVGAVGRQLKARMRCLVEAVVFRTGSAAFVRRIEVFLAVDTFLAIVEGVTGPASDVILGSIGQ